MSLSHQELLCLCMGHAQIPKLALRNCTVTAMPRFLQCPKCLNLPCVCCSKAKSVPQPLPPALTSTSERKADLMTEGLFDIMMSEQSKTIDENRYSSIPSSNALAMPSPSSTAILQTCSLVTRGTQSSLLTIPPTLPLSFLPCSVLHHQLHQQRFCSCTSCISNTSVAAPAASATLL